MKCQICKKSFKQGQQVVPVMKYIENEKRGDFTSSPVGYIHLFHIPKEQ